MEAVDPKGVCIDEIAANLELGDSGIWFSKGKSEVSYPSAGNESCFEIEDHSFWFRHRNRCINTVVRGFPPAGAIFDLGGGNGFVSLALQQDGWQNVVVEPGRAGALNARKRGLVNVICSTLEDADFRSHSLPAAGLFDVLEHLADDQQFLECLRERLAPGGRVYLSVPAYQWLWSAEDVSAGHFRRYTLSSLKSVLRLSGFQIDYASYIFSPLPPAILLKRTIPSLLGRRSVENTDDGVQEHRSGSATLTRILDGVFEWELRMVERKKTIPVGGSCLVVARSR